MISQVDQYLKNGKVIVLPQIFAIVKAAKVFPQAFANIVDQFEITVIVDTQKLADVEVLEAQTGWKIFTLDIVFPMDVCGVTTKIAGALAKESISIMPIAAYSRDHFLIKEVDSDRAISVLQSIGLSM